jgi:hypothetical protein
LLSGKPPKPIYVAICELLDNLDRLNPTPPAALLALASITDFDLYISSAIDSLLVKALERCRPGFQRGRDVITYDSKTPLDVPERIERALVYHILGNRDTHPNFVVWEEDYLQFILALVRHDQQLKNLFLLLKTRYLLFLGAPFEDWIVRFFLFLVKGGRFTDRRRDEIQAYLADRPENLGEPLIFFFDKVVGTTRIILGTRLTLLMNCHRAGRPSMWVAALTKMCSSKCPMRCRAALYSSVIRARTVRLFQLSYAA